MSRYPGTQFKVHDNSQTTAIVPVANVNSADAVQYMTSFASIKGPEGITLTSGEDFYTRYGTQDNIDFKKYGQPLFQASMNINNGATLLAKRVVFDDATLANATLAIVLTKYKDAIIKVDEDNPELIHSISFNTNGSSKYSIAPMVFSIDNKNNNVFANETVNEYKERYDLYKNYIIEVLANDVPNNKFLNKLNKENIKLLSGFTQSIYYDDNDKVINLNSKTETKTKSDVRKVSSITTGIYSSNQKTYSSNFTVDDIINANSEGKSKPISIKEPISSIGITDAKIYQLKVEKDVNGNITKISWNTEPLTAPESQNNAWYISDIAKIPVSRIIKEDNDNNTPGDNAQKIINEHPEWYDSEYAGDISSERIIITKDIDTFGYTSTTRLINDLMVENSGYVECEYVFPMFTIFDNGRGESIKSISIDFDAPSSATLKKAVYSLSVYNYASSKRLEKYSFSLNPYIRNDNTGFTFDIESAVNYKSKQISVKTYYESYDALLETFQSILNTVDKDIITNNDILFGHKLNGKYPTFNSYRVSTYLNRNTYIYDYAHLDIFDNDIITVNTYCDCDNMTILDNDTSVKYYYYNYIRNQKLLLEKLEMGSNGYDLSRKNEENPKYNIPFIVIDTNDENNSKNFVDVINVAGHKNGTLISDVNRAEADSNISLIPNVVQNFMSVDITLYKITRYNGTEAQKGDYYTTHNTNTINKSNVHDKVPTPTPVGEYWVFDKAAPTVTTTVWIPITQAYLYQEHYRRFFNGEFDRDIFNLDIYFPNAIFDANYSKKTKLAIQRLAAYRGDFMCYMDMGIGEVNSYTDCANIIPSTLSGLELTDVDNEYCYVRDMHIAITCIYYKMRNPYDNKVIEVTATYGLSNLYISHFANDVSKVFAGISNGITINNILEGTVNYIPKIYPTNEMTSLSNIGGVYPSDDATIVNEKQLMCDLKVNYGCYYDDRFSIETEYTLNPTESEFSYWNNVALVCLMMQAIRRACPSARYQFITSNDLNVYKTAVEAAMKPWKNRFAKITFKYVQDEAAIENKIFYAAIEVVFKPFAQAEIFELTALNYSTLSSTITNV